MQICNHDFVIEDIYTYLHCITFQQLVKQNKGEVELPLHVTWTLSLSLKTIIADCIKFTTKILDKMFLYFRQW